MRTCLFSEVQKQKIQRQQQIQTTIKLHGTHTASPVHCTLYVHRRKSCLKLGPGFFHPSRPAALESTIRSS